MSGARGLRCAMIRVIACAVSILMGCATPLAATPTPMPMPAAAPEPEPIVAPAAKTFDFRSGFWLNLHLRLHYAATGRRAAPDDAPEPPAGAGWSDAVAHYRSTFGERGGFAVVFDEELIAIERALAALPSDANHPSGVPAELAAHLTAAGALVRADWPDEDRRNRAWVDALEPWLRRHAPALRESLAAAYQTPWPTEPLRVEVSCFAGPVGAFTVNEPALIAISSCDPALRDEIALEMIFHEASHTLIGRIEEKIDAEAKHRGQTAPRDLWHAVLFYTTGVIATHELGGSYVPYATKNGLWERGSFVGVEPALRREWQPYLDGERDLDTAIAALLDALD